MSELNTQQLEIAQTAHGIWKRGPSENSRSTKWRAAVEDKLGEAKMQLITLPQVSIYSLETAPDDTDQTVRQNLGFLAIRRILFFPDGEIFADFSIQVHADDSDEEVDHAFRRAEQLLPIDRRGVNEQSYADLVGLLRAGRSQRVYCIREAAIE